MQSMRGFGEPKRKAYIFRTKEGAEEFRARAVGLRIRGKVTLRRSLPDYASRTRSERHEANQWAVYATAFAAADESDIASLARNIQEGEERLAKEAEER